MILGEMYWKNHRPEFSKRKKKINVEEKIADYHAVTWHVSGMFLNPEIMSSAELKISWRKVVSILFSPEQASTACAEWLQYLCFEGLIWEMLKYWYYYQFFYSELWCQGIKLIK